MVIENAKDEPPRSRCCKVCLRKFFMQQSYVKIFGAFGITKAVEGQESHQDVEERIKLKHSDLKLRCEAVQDKQQLITKMKFRIQHLDRQHLEREEEFKMVILYQQEKFSEERETAIIQENRINEKQNDLDRLKRERNQLIDKNFEDKNSINEWSRHVESQRVELAQLKGLIKQARKELDQDYLVKDLEDKKSFSLSLRRQPTASVAGSAGWEGGGVPNMVVFTASNQSDMNDRRFRDSKRSVNVFNSGNPFDGDSRFADHQQFVKSAT